MNFWKAVKLAHLGRTKEIETVRYYNIIAWAPGEWDDYRKYCNAVDYLYDRHNLILRFLRWINYV